ncbi:MAG: RNA polymerase sigma factor [Chitinophagaceae bacterium]
MTSTAKHSETELVALLQQRDQQSFSYLYDNYSGALLGVVSAVVPDMETARDVLQEVFVNIWRKIDTYDPSKGRLFTWMMNVARNAAIDKIRSRGFQDSRKNNALPESGEISGPGLVSGNDARDVGLKKVLATLKEEHRILIELSYYQGYTHEEIAKSLSIPLGTVKTRIRTALSQLRTIVKR